MLEALTGGGLATASGLNAYIPMLTLGLLSRYTDFMNLPDSWKWLENPWVLGVIAVLLVVELLADKIPIIDSINDVLQTAVRPTAGGLTFGATASATGSSADAAGPSALMLTSPTGSFLGDNSWIAVVAGVVIALLVHVAKSLIRPVINGTTLGLGAPVASTAEDGISLGMSVVAIILPFLVIIFVIALAIIFWRARKRLAQMKADRATRSAT